MPKENKKHSQQVRTQWTIRIKELFPGSRERLLVYAGKIHKVFLKQFRCIQPRYFPVYVFFIGLILLAAGTYMKLNNILSNGQSYKTRLGTSINAESIDGNGALFFGIFILIISLVSNRIYISQKKKRDKRVEEEKYFN